VCLCLSVHLCLSVSICVCLCLSVSICVCLCLSVCLCVCVCIFQCLFLSMCVCVRIYVCAHTTQHNTHAHTRKHTHIYIYIYKIAASDEKHADVVLINTCAIRENAEKRIWERLRTLRLQKNKTNALASGRVAIGLLGCMAEVGESNTLQHTATHTATPCNTHCNTLQRAATRGYRASRVYGLGGREQHTATHCNT